MVFFIMLGLAVGLFLGWRPEALSWLFRHHPFWVAGVAVVLIGAMATPTMAQAGIGVMCALAVVVAVALHVFRARQAE